MQDKIKALRKAFVDGAVEMGNVPILFSGGIDSATILFAFLEAGFKPVCYTFQYGDYLSQDVVVAEKICKHFSVDWKKVIVPSDEVHTINDVREMLSTVVKKLKTHVQCSIPFKYLAKQIKEDGYNSAVMGMAAGDLCPTSKNAMMTYRRSGNGEWNKYRRTHYFNNGHESNDSCIAISKKYGVEIHDLYKNANVGDILLGCNFDEIHKKYQKSILVKCFLEYWKKGEFYRPNTSLQVASKLRDHHDLLLKSKYNRGHKKVIGIYRDIEKGII